MFNVKSGVAIATAAAAMFAMAGTVTVAHAADGMVKCSGANSCKGTAECKTAKNDCKGQNSCKGHGFKEMTAKQCTTAGGSLTEPK